MEWQPIETAPRDREILAFCNRANGEISGVIERPEGFIAIISGGPTRADHDSGDGWWHDAGGDYYSTWVWPTHWMPLPEPPNA